MFILFFYYCFLACLSALSAGFVIIGCRRTPGLSVVCPRTSVGLQRPRSLLLTPRLLGTHDAITKVFQVTLPLCAVLLAYIRLRFFRGGGVGRGAGGGCEPRVGWGCDRFKVLLLTALETRRMFAAVLNLYCVLHT